MQKMLVGLMLDTGARHDAPRRRSHHALHSSNRLMMTSLMHPFPGVAVRRATLRVALAVAALATIGACVAALPSPRPRAPTRPARRAPIRASASSAGLMDAGEAIVEPARRSRRRRRPSSSSAAPTPTSRSPATTPSRATTTASRSGTSPTPAQPTLATAYYCPASQSDVSVYKNLLFVSGEGSTARLDCGAQGVQRHGEQGAPARHPHLRHHATSRNPKNVGNVQTCRGSHTHTVLEDPKDTENVYIYVSGSARRPLAERAAGLRRARRRTRIPNSALFRIEVIKVPLANPEQAAIVSSPRIFNDLDAPPRARRDARRTSPPRRRRVAAAQGARRVHRAMIQGAEQVAAAAASSQPHARQHREGARRHRRADGGRQRRRCARRCPAIVDADVRRAAEPDAARARSDAVPRHHGLSGDRPGRRRVRGLRPAARHQRPGEPGAHRRRRRLELLVLALGDVQQRRHARSCSPTSGAAAAQPKCRATRQEGVGRGRDLHDRERQDEVPELLQAAGARRRRARTASRTTAR